MRKLLSILQGIVILISLLLAHQRCLASAPAPTLKVGILPFNSTLALMRTHQPLRAYLQKELGQPVELFTAPDYKRFLKACMEGAYDLAIMPPHFGLLSLEKGYIPLVHYKAHLEIVLVTAKKSPIHHVHQLKGLKVAMTQPTSFVSIAGIKYLKENGFVAGHNITLIEKPTHGAGLAAVALGEVDAALSSATIYRQLPRDIQEKVQLHSTGVRVPHVFTMVHQRLGTQQIQKIKEKLGRFEHTPEGQRFFKETSYGGYEPLTSEEMKLFTPYLHLFRQIQGEGL